MSNIRFVQLSLIKTHASVRRSHLMLVLALLPAIWIGASNCVLAQSASMPGSSGVLSTQLPPPPAMAIADRLYKAGRFADAVKKLGDITSSASYKNTPYAPEAVYRMARIYRDNLHDDNNAITQYNALANNYPALTYPHRSAAMAEREDLGKRIDSINSKEPYYKFIDWFVGLTGHKPYSYWIALLLISVVVRLVLTPLTLKQYRSMREMQRLQPLLKELQAKYKGDKQVLGQKTLELYKEHGANPASSCLPMLFQLPIFWAMYHAVWMYQYRFAGGTFAWIGTDLSHHYPQYLASNLSQQDIPLLLLYSVSMYLTQRMMPAADPSQAEMQRTSALMTSVFFFILFQNYHFPSAFVLYWLISNILGTATQLYFMRQGIVPMQGQKPQLAADGDKAAVPLTGSSRRMLASATGSNGAANGSTSNDATAGADIKNRGTGARQPSAKGVISPKVHPKKRRR